LIELTGTIAAVSSLHIGTGKKSGTFSETLGYLPGRTIRGMIGYYLHSNERDLFDKLRISEDMDMSKTGVFFKDALPVYVDKNTLTEKITVASPVSLKWCKKCDNLMEYGIKECNNIVSGKKCLHEGKKVTGFVTKDSFITGKLEKADVNKHIETKCPITRGGHTSPGSDFELSPYHVESVSPKTKFSFRCIVEDEFADDMKRVLNEAGVFAGLGGYRSRGYGTVAFSDIHESQISDVIEKRANEISEISNLMMVANSPMILMNQDSSIIGFGTEYGNIFNECATKTLTFSGYEGKLQFNLDNNDQVKQLLNEGIARGWSIKNDNKVSEVKPCIGHGSCAEITSNNHSALAALEVYGVGEMTNSGYGDVYFTEGKI